MAQHAFVNTQANAAIFNAIDKNGGWLDSEMVMNKLNITAAELVSRYKNNALLGIFKDENIYFPAFQFNTPHTQQCVQALLSTLSGNLDAKNTLLFFLTPQPLRNGDMITPLFWITKMGKDLDLDNLLALQHSALAYARLKHGR